MRWTWTVIGAVLVLAGCGAPSTATPDVRFRAVEPVIFADLERSDRIAGISLESYMFSPDQAELDAEFRRGRIGPSWSERCCVDLKGMRGGDFERVRLEFNGYESRAVCVTVVPRWGDVSGLDARCRQLNLQLGELAAFSSEFGPVVRTSHEGWLASVGKDSEGRAQLEALVIPLTPDLFPPAEGWLAVGKLEEFLREEASHGRTETTGYWTRMLELAASLQLEPAGALLASLEGDVRSLLEPALELVDEEFDDAAMSRKLELLAYFAKSAEEAVLSAGSIDRDSHAAFHRRLQQTLDALRRDASVASQSGRIVEAGVYSAILASYGRNVAIHKLEATDWVGLHRVLRWASLGGWLIGQHELVAEGTLEDAVAQCRQSGGIAASYTHPDDVSKLVLDEYIRGYRKAVAAAEVVRAQAAERRGLYATAVGHYLTAHGLLEESTYLMQQSLETERARLLDPPRPIEDRDALALARRAGLKLAAEVLPFAETRADAAGDFRKSFDGAALLAGLPFADNRRLGLELGTREAQRAFAQASKAQLCEVSSGSTRVLSIDVSTATVQYEKSLERRRVVSNDQAYLAWEMELDGLLRKLEQLEERSNRLLLQSLTVREMRPWDRIGAFHGDSDVSEWRIETLASALDRLADAESSRLVVGEMERVRAEYDRLWARRPARSSVEIESRLASYPVDVQTWRVNVARDVAVTVGGERHAYEGGSELRIECLRVASRPDIGVVAVDQWIDEERARTLALRDGIAPSDSVLFALRCELGERLRARALGLEQRDLTEEERWNERIWQGYLFHADWARELESGIPQVEALGHAYARP